MDRDTRERVGANVRAEIARKGRHQKDAAEYLGTSQQNLSRRLLGHVPFTATELLELAHFLAVDITAFGVEVQEEVGYVLRERV